jgi:hypothetical protein
MAADPLSTTSRSLACETRVAEVGSGYERISRYCSPWRSIMGLKFGTTSDMLKGVSAEK